MILFIIGLSALILIHELGHFIAAKTMGLLVHEFGFGFPPRLLHKRIGETLYSLNALPFGGFVKIHGEQAEEEPKEDAHRRRSFVVQPAWRRAVILLAGVLMNFLLGWIIFSMLFVVGVPTAVVLTDVIAGSPAARAGLLRGDEIAGFADAKAFTDSIARFEGQEITLTARRAGKEFSVRVTPRVNPPKDEGRLGVVFTETGIPRKPFFAAFGSGFLRSLEVVGMIGKSLGTLVLGIFTGARVLKDIVGPVGIFQVAHESAQYGLASILQLIGLISLNLAVLNILPFPALDGGRLLFLLIEKIKGSPLSPKREAIANAIGLSLLLILMVVITVRDVVKLF